MQRAEFENYRRAYGNLLVCTAAREKSNGDCVEGWIRDAGTLISDVEQQRAKKMMEYYVDNVLRGKAERIEKMCSA